MGTSHLKAFCLTIACALATTPAPAAILLTGGNAADGLALDPANTVFALDVGHRVAPFYAVQGVTFAGNVDPYVGGPGSIGGFSGEFNGAFAWPKANSTADDNSLAEVMKSLYFSGTGIDWAVSQLNPGGQYRVDILQSTTATFNAREQAVLINGAWMENVMMNRDPDNGAAGVYDSQFFITADANGSFNLGVRPSAAYGGTGPNDGCLINGLVVTAVPAAVPEPCSLTLLGLGSLAALAARRRRA